MINIVCCVCGEIVESFTPEQYNKNLEYIQKVYINQDNNLCSKCWIEKHKGADVLKKVLPDLNRGKSTPSGGYPISYYGETYWSNDFYYPDDNEDSTR